MYSLLLHIAEKWLGDFQGLKSNELADQGSFIRHDDLPPVRRKR